RNDIIPTFLLKEQQHICQNFQPPSLKALTKPLTSIPKMRICCYCLHQKRNLSLIQFNKMFIFSQSYTDICRSCAKFERLI
ncbi:hypothetical protein VIGAN_06056600, partial [Vigna angularis var. angularis]